jgi:hypothetical protein
LLPDIVVTALRNDDTDEIVALYNRATATEPRIGPVPRSVWQRFVTSPHNLNARDFRVVRCEQRVIALAESHLKNQGQCVMRFCKLVVDLAYRRRGIGSDVNVGVRLANFVHNDERRITLAFPRRSRLASENVFT